MTTHVLRPVPPLRAYLLSAILAVVGVGFLVVGARGSIWVLSLGALVLAGGLVLLGAAVLSVRRYRVSVDFADQGYVIHGANGDVSGTWQAITRVTRSADGTQLTFHQGDEKRTVLIGRDVGELESEVAARLDRSRGYGSGLGPAAASSDATR